MSLVPTYSDIMKMNTTYYLSRWEAIRGVHESYGEYTVKRTIDGDTIVSFPATGHWYRTPSESAFSGNVRDPFAPIYYGVGYLGVGYWQATLYKKQLPYYKLWVKMLKKHADVVVKRWYHYQDFCDDLYQMHSYKDFIKEDGKGWELEFDVMFSIHSCRLVGPNNKNGKWGRDNRR